MSRPHLIIEADGGSRGNPGPAGYGAVVLDESDSVLAERDGFLGVETNNVAEYSGLIAGLRAAQELGAGALTVRMDSKLVVEQMAGRWQIKNDRLRALAADARALAAGFEDVRYEWIPRARNGRADRLANVAMDRGGTAPATASAPATKAPGWVPPSGPATRLLLVRHGSTAHSAEFRLSGRNDLPLDPAGSAQAAALAARAAGLGPVTALVSSPVRRARQTADWIASALGLDVVEDERFAEIDFGDWEGLTGAEVRARDGAAFAAWTASPDVPPPGGESMSALAGRVRAGRDAVVAAHPGEQVVLVTHVTPIKTLVADVLGAPPASVHRMFLSTASVSGIEYYADGRGALRLFNDTSHLTR